MGKFSLFSLFAETFSSERGGLPGGWATEQNSDMPHVPAICCGDHCIELLSAGNKFIPIIPDTGDFHVRFSFSINYDSAEQFGIIVCFRYNMLTRRGQYIRISAPYQDSTVTVEYGTTRQNLYTVIKSQSFKADSQALNELLELELTVIGTKVELAFLGKNFRFTAVPGKGKIALARNHFYDVLQVHSFIIEGEAPEAQGEEVSFTVPMPECMTYYPIYCDVNLRDYGNCLDATLTFRGGIPDSKLGEGNYHGIRMDLLERPYLKILTQSDTDKHVIYNDKIVLIPPGIAPKYFYGAIYKKVEWPFQRRVRFIKPEGKFDLAVGFECWYHRPAPNMELNPGETVFDTSGKVLYSGLGFSSGENTKIELLSQPDKEIIKRLPKSDPRYERALKFAQENHYFFEKENPDFTIRLTSWNPIPEKVQIILEDAYFRKIKELSYTKKRRTQKIDLRSYGILELKVERPGGLACGVHHLRMQSLDKTLPPLEDYWAFEIMSRRKDALPAPLLSGMPFLYNARTETRGLMTDAFDPWIGSSVNEGHYVSCSVMLPEAFRKYKMGPTIRAYQRGNFSWISTRTLDNPELEDNLDVVKESTYINVGDCNEHMNITWEWSFYGARFQTMIDFLRTLKDPYFDIPKLQALQKAGEIMPREVYIRVAENYWEKWLDFFNDYIADFFRQKLELARTVNPKVQIAQYGPFHIYCSALKGPEAIRLMGNEKVTNDLNAFWQYEDYPSSCGYGLEHGLYHLTSCLMALPGSRIYPEIYTSSKLKQGCPDGAVFYAHPPYGIAKGQRSPNTLIRQIAGLVYGSGHLMEDGFHYWTKRGFQVCGCPTEWYEVLLKFWPTVLDHQPERPLRSAAYISSPDSRLANGKVILEEKELARGVVILDVRTTSTEEVPLVYETAARAGLCGGFQLFDRNLEKLSASQVDTLVLPPLKGMSPKVLKKIRSLHEEGVNLLCFENVAGLEDVFSVKDTRKFETISAVRGTDQFCPGKIDYCDDERCQGSYQVIDAQVLLQAEIPVLTIKHNKKAAAAFFNVPPQLVRESGLHQRCYGNNSISPLIEEAIGTLMHRFSDTGITASSGYLFACHTKENKVMVAITNPDDSKPMVTEITLSRAIVGNAEPAANFEVMMIAENKQQRIYRARIPDGEVLTMQFEKTQR